MGEGQLSKSRYQYVLIAGLGLSIFSLIGCQTSVKTTKDPAKSLQVRTQLAAEYIRTGDLDAAKRALDLAFEINSRDATANMMMGVLLQQESSPSNLKKAEQYFRRAISADSSNAQARANYGTYLYQMQRYEDALEQLEIAGSTLGYEQRFRALENVGRIQVLLGNLDAAELAFKQALSVSRDSVISMLELSEIFYLRENIASAVQTYEQYVRTVGQNNQGARALWIGIRIARAQGDHLGMQRLVNQLRAVFPDSQEYQRYLQLQYTTEAVWK